ncbi:MAG: hypothetical protein RLZZ419_1511 [Pseudomonadota bacterium]|jgi:hypothetical protein
MSTQALPALIGVINSITKPLKNTERWQLVRGACSQTPLEWHPQLKAAFVNRYVHNRGKPTNDREAEAAIESAYLSSGNQDIKTFYRVASALGAICTYETKLLIESVTGNVTLPPAEHRKLTPEQKTERALDESLDHAERGYQFMGCNDPDELFPIKRRDNLRSMREQARSPSDSPYLVGKGINTIEGDAFIYGDRLIVPIYSPWHPEAEGVTGYQTIYPDGTKRFLKGQPTIGQAAFIGDVTDCQVILVCEGWATGQRVYEATSLPVAAVLSLGNIHAVAAGLLNPEGDTAVRSVLICADTGHDAKMQEVVDSLRAYGFSAKWCKPSSLQDNYDFDDQYRELGIDSVKQVIMGALANPRDPNEPEHKAKFIQSLPELMTGGKPAKSLVKGVIYEKSLNSLTGPTMSYKSFIAVKMSFCIATGQEFFSRKVRQANVLYIAGEGHYGLKARFRSLQIESGLQKMPDNLFISNGPIDLLNLDDVATTRKFIEDNNIELIVVDTFARCYIGDENSSKEMGQAIQALTTQFIAVGAAVLLVHHTGHGDQTRARGSSAFRASLDVEIGVERTAVGLKLKCWKSKDFEAWPDENYRTVVVETGLLDEDGEIITSLVLEPCEASSPKPLELNPEQKRIVSTLTGLIQPFNFELALSNVNSLITDRQKTRTLTRLIERLLKSQQLIESEGFYSFA